MIDVEWLGHGFDRGVAGDALRVLAQRNLTVVAVAVSESAVPGAPLDETVATIARFADMIEVVGVPRLGGEAHSHPAVARIAALIEG